MAERKTHLPVAGHDQDLLQADRHHERHKIATEDVLKVLRPIWATKTETAIRLRGRIERILDAAKAKGYRDGENPARWRGHLDHLLAKPQKLTRGHHASMRWADLPVFIKTLRQREAIAARALEFTILTAARTGETLGARWGEIDLSDRNLDGPGDPHESWPGASRTPY